MGLFGGGNASTNASQSTATLSGASTSAQGNNNKDVFGNVTTVANNQKTSIASTSNSNNKIGVANGGTVNYNTTTNGISAADLAAFGNTISGSSGSGGGSSGSGGGGTVISNTPPQGIASTLATASTAKWGIWAGLGLVVAVVYFIFLKNKKS